MLSCFKNCNSPQVINEVDIYTIIDNIQNPHEVIIQLISNARKLKKEGKVKEYNSLKRSLPCVTFNFNFNRYKGDKNIKGSTGLIYIDIDEKTNIDLQNPYIFSTWISLSGQGRGVLVKVKNLSLENFKETYKSISKRLNINSDMGSAKATQCVVLSYDKNIYINNDSLIWKSRKRVKKHSNKPSNRVKRERRVENV